MLKLVQATRSKWPQSKSSKKSKRCRKMSANVSSNASASLDRVKSLRISSTPLRISRKSASFQWKQHLTKRRGARELSISRRREILARFLPAQAWLMSKYALPIRMMIGASLIASFFADRKQKGNRVRVQLKTVFRPGG